MIKALALAFVLACLVSAGCQRKEEVIKIGVAGPMTGDQAKLENIAIIHEKTTYGQGLADEFKKFVKERVEVFYYGGIIHGDKDFKTVLTSIKGKRPELIYFCGIYPEAGLLVKQARGLGITIPFMSGDGTIDKEFIKIAGKENAEGTYLTF